jgi:hypothetical protein
MVVLCSRNRSSPERPQPMAETQYELFRDLDRHCVAGGVHDKDYLEAVRRKRACIDSQLNRDNPLVREVLEGRTTFAAVYDRYSHAFRGIRRFLPMAHDDAWNERLEQLARIIPNVQHFLRRSALATDNPMTCALYGVVASAAVSLVWMHAASGDNDGGEFNSVVVFALALGLGCFGFGAGLFAVKKYRTRDPHRIHAREAAGYMDLNYNCYRTFDDEAWAKFVALKTTPPGCGGAPASAMPSMSAPHAAKSAATT